MVKDHYLFTKPRNHSQNIWRYLDFTKFVDLLNSKELFFSRADLFNDPFEGSIPIKAYSHREETINALIEKGEVLPEYEDAKIISDESKAITKNMYINCWHVNNNESAAMWKLYLKTNEGICIQSKYKLLEKSLKSSIDEIHLGLVKYINYETDSIDWGNVLAPFVHKRKSFEHENELRALIWKMDSSKQSGIRIEVNLNELISNIYICPDSPRWFKKIVGDIALKFKLDAPVIQSELSRDPFF